MSFKERCYLVYGIAPEGMTAKKANHALNEWIKNEKLGKIIYHEHFSNKPFGGIAIFEVQTPEELEYLFNEPRNEDSYLYGWKLYYHPLLHGRNTERFLYQVQYTLFSYRGVLMNYSLEN